jgi:hypothetical protein
MSDENDYCRRLLLLGGEIVDAEKELSELRNIITDHKEELPEWFGDEIINLQKTITRIKQEYGEIIQTLSSIEGDLP